MTAETLRQQLAQLSDLQATLDAMKTDLLIRLKEIQTHDDRYVSSV